MTIKKDTVMAVGGLLAGIPETGFPLFFSGVWILIIGLDFADKQALVYSIPGNDRLAYSAFLIP